MHFVKSKLGLCPKNKLWIKPIRFVTFFKRAKARSYWSASLFSSNWLCFFRGLRYGKFEFVLYFKITTSFILSNNYWASCVFRIMIFLARTSTSRRKRRSRNPEKKRYSPGAGKKKTSNKDWRKETLLIVSSINL